MPQPYLREYAPRRDSKYWSENRYNRVRQKFNKLRDGFDLMGGVDDVRVPSALHVPVGYRAEVADGEVYGETADDIAWIERFCPLHGWLLSDQVSTPRGDGMACPEGHVIMEWWDVK